MEKKYNWLTKEILEQDYVSLGNFKLISEKYNIPRSTIEKYCKDFGIRTTPKIRYDVNHHIFATDTEISFYLAGFIAADGCISAHKSKEPNCITICLSKKDNNFLEALKNLIEFSGPITITKSDLSKYIKNYKDAYYHSRFIIYSKQMIKDLSRFGIGQRKSLTYDFPEWIITHPLANHFMRGYSDGDGSFYFTNEKHNTKKRGITTCKKHHFSLRGTESFLQKFKQVMENNNVITVSNPKFNNGIHQLRYSGNGQTRKVASFLYKNATIYMQRKFDVIKELIV